VTFTIGIVLFSVGLLAVILIHELGHYVAARAFGFKVEEYFVGFGPKLWSTRRGEIEYGVKALPLGGYVRITGMNPFQEVSEADRPRAYGSKPAWQRAIVIAAGPLSHLVVAFVLFSIWIALVGSPYGPVTVFVDQVVPRLNGQVSPAETAGLRPGDVLLRAGPIDVASGRSMVRYTTAHIGDPVPLVIRRDDRTLHVTVTPVAWTDPSTGDTIGRIGILTNGRYETVGPARSVLDGGRLVGTTIVQSFGQIGQVFGPNGIGSTFRALFLGAPRTAQDPQSVVGVARVVGTAAQRGGLVDVLQLLGFVTVFIGLLNLVPLPPFDGGHLAVLVIEVVRGRAVDMRKLIPVSAVVISTLVLFVGMTLILDLTKRAPLP